MTQISVIISLMIENTC